MQKLAAAGAIAYMSQAEKRASGFSYFLVDTDEKIAAELKFATKVIMCWDAICVEPFSCTWSQWDQV